VAICLDDSLMSEIAAARSSRTPCRGSARNDNVGFVTQDVG